MADILSNIQKKFLSELERYLQGRVRYVNNFVVSSQTQAVNAADRFISSILKDAGVQIPFTLESITNEERRAKFAESIINYYINKNRLTTNVVGKVAYTLIKYNSNKTELEKQLKGLAVGQIMKFGVSKSDAENFVNDIINFFSDERQKAAAATVSGALSWGNAKNESFYKKALTKSFVGENVEDTDPLVHKTLEAIRSEYTSQVQEEISNLSSTFSVFTVGSSEYEIEFSNITPISVDDFVVNTTGITSLQITSTSDEGIDKEFEDFGKNVVSEISSSINSKISKIAELAEDYPSIASNPNKAFVINEMAQRVTQLVVVVETPNDGLSKEILQSGKETFPSSTVRFNSAIYIEPEGAVDVANVQEANKRVVVNVSTSKTPQGSVPYTELAWVLEWVPNLSVGMVKFNIEELYPQEEPIDILTINYPDGIIVDPIKNTFYNNNRSILLPLSTTRLAVLKEFNLSRRNIQNTVVTHGSRYYEVFAETFPSFTLTIETVMFGNVPEKVQNFFDSVFYFINNPKQYSGSLYMYDVFKNKPLIMKKEFRTLYRPTKKYKLLPQTYYKARSADDNNILKITINGIVVEW